MSGKLFQHNAYIEALPRLLIVAFARYKELIYEQQRDIVRRQKEGILIKSYL